MTSLPRLTPHQTSVLRRIYNQTARTGQALSTNIGCAGAVNHLRAKGYVTVEIAFRGPRGGETYRYVLTTAAHESGAWRTPSTAKLQAQILVGQAVDIATKDGETLSGVLASVGQSGIRWESGSTVYFSDIASITVRTEDGCLADAQ